MTEVTRSRIYWWLRKGVRFKAQLRAEQALQTACAELVGLREELLKAQAAFHGPRILEHNLPDLFQKTGPAFAQAIDHQLAVRRAYAETGATVRKLEAQLVQAEHHVSYLVSDYASVADRAETQFYEAVAALTERRRRAAFVKNWKPEKVTIELSGYCAYLSYLVDDCVARTGVTRNDAWAVTLAKYSWSSEQASAYDFEWHAYDVDCDETETARRLAIIDAWECEVVTIELDESFRRFLPDVAGYTDHRAGWARALGRYPASPEGLNALAYDFTHD